MPIYNVRVVAPAINEATLVEAVSVQEAKEKAIYHSLERQYKAAEITIIPISTPEPDDMA
jgi:hypothetical protein